MDIISKIGEDSKADKNKAMRNEARYNVDKKYLIKDLVDSVDEILALLLVRAIKHNSVNTGCHTIICTTNEDSMYEHICEILNLLGVDYIVEASSYSFNYIEEVQIIAEYFEEQHRTENIEFKYMFKLRSTKFFTQDKDVVEADTNPKIAAFKELLESVYEIYNELPDVFYTKREIPDEKFIYYGILGKIPQEISPVNEFYIEAIFYRFHTNRTIVAEHSGIINPPVEDVEPKKDEGSLDKAKKKLSSGGKKAQSAAKIIGKVLWFITKYSVIAVIAYLMFAAMYYADTGEIFGLNFLQ